MLPQKRSYLAPPSRIKTELSLRSIHFSRNVDYSQQKGHEFHIAFSIKFHIIVWLTCEQQLDNIKVIIYDPLFKKGAMETLRS